MRIINYIRFGIRDPLATLNFVMFGPNRVNLIVLKRLGKQLGASNKLINELYQEIHSNDKFNGYVSSALSSLSYLGWIIFPEGLYILVRILKPTYVVETGVATGVSSAYILMGLEMNNKGELFSIDLPNYELEYFPKLSLKPVSIIPKEKNVGFAIPPWLKHRWHLILGNSRETLPKLLNELKTIDIFLHDSEHTYDHMMFEYHEAWNHLKSGGLLLSDNVFMNRAFEDFAKEVKARSILLYFAGWGCIIKQ
jgi:hypothetical protein